MFMLNMLLGIVLLMSQRGHSIQFTLLPTMGSRMECIEHYRYEHILRITISF